MKIRAAWVWLAYVAGAIGCELVLLFVVQGKHEFDLGDPAVLGAFARKVCVDVGLLAAPCGLLLAARRTRWVAAGLAAFAYFALAVDAGVYLYGNTFFEHDHLALIAPYSLWGFLGLETAGLVLVWIGGTALAFGLAWVAEPTGRWPRRLTLGAVGLGMLGVGLGLGAVDWTEGRPPPGAFDRHTYAFRNEQLRYVGERSLFGVVRSLWGHEEPGAFAVIDDPTPFAATLADTRLPLGPRDYPELGRAPVHRVIWILLESVSLDLIGAHNPALPIEPMPFFMGRPDVAGQTFTELYTTAAPTLEALTVTFTSHPNYGGMRDPKDYRRQDEAGRPLYYRLAFPRLLAEAGFHTIFMRSASKYYAHENLVFRDFGFQEIIGREDFYARENLRSEIYGWGLKDRFLYEAMIERLEEDRDAPIFLAVLGTDTHPPFGEEHFDGLDYPPLPAGLAQAYPPGPTRFFKALHHLDYDLAQAMTELQARGLLDEGTLVVITADHACPLNPVVHAVPGYPETNLARIPLVLASGAPLPPVPRDVPASQVDLAPTLFHLLGLPIPEGWWGESLFSPRRQNPRVGFDRGVLSLQQAGGASWVVDVRSPEPAARDLVRLFRSVYAP